MNYSLLRIFVVLFCLFGSIRSFSYDAKKDLITNNLPVTQYSIDSNTSAVVLYEKTMHLIDNSYKHIKTVRRIIKILKDDAVDYANVTIPYPYNDYRNYVHNIKAVTYNLENGKVVEAEVNKQDLLGKRVFNNAYVVKFSLSSVKAGSIIDYSYEKVTSGFEWFYSWEIQDNIPKLISEFEMNYPDKYDFTSVMNLATPPKIFPTVDEALKGGDNFCKVLDRKNLGDVGLLSAYWVRKNVQALKQEPFVVNAQNYAEQVDLQVTGYSGDNGHVYVNNSWKKLNDALWKEEFIYKEVSGNNYYLNKIVDSISAFAKTDMQKAKAIYQYIRNSFEKESEFTFNVRKKPDVVFENKHGTSTEINLLLTALLLQAGLNAAPVVLGTTDLRSNVKIFPVEGRLNRIVASVQIDSNDIFLDASNKNIPFGRLELDCYNGYSWILGNEGRLADLNNEQLFEKSVTVVKINNFTDSTAQVEIVEKLGMFSSEVLRKNLRKDEAKIQEFIDAYIKELSGNFKYEKHQIENLNTADTNLTMKFNFELGFDKIEPSLFINSIMVKFINSNPLKDTRRILPFEYPYRSQQQYLLTIKFPAGYAPDTLAKPILINYENGNMAFKKSVAFYESMSTLSVNASLEINKTRFEREEADEIRSFYQLVINENNDLLSIKKSKK